MDYEVIVIENPFRVLLLQQRVSLMPYCDKVYIKEISGFTFDQCQLSPGRNEMVNLWAPLSPHDDINISRYHEIFIFPDEMEHEIELQSIKVSLFVAGKHFVASRWLSLALNFSRQSRYSQIVPR